MKRIREYWTLLKERFNQIGLKYKFKFKRYVTAILESQFVGSTFQAAAYSLAITLALSLKFSISWKLYFASVGIYFVAEEILSRIDLWFKNFGR